MKTANIDDLTERVRRLLNASKLKDLVRGVSIEPAESTDDSEVLRVRIKVAHSEKMSSRDASELIDRIVDDLWTLDDRFPSVWFDEAA